jgi:hypothetical protein
MVTIHYLTQARVSPPTFLLFANHPTAVDKAYNRFIANRLRERYGFHGSPLRVIIKAKGNRVESGRKKGRRDPKAAKSPKRGQANRGRTKRGR